LVVEAEKVAQANLIKCREETAATRFDANVDSDPEIRREEIPDADAASRRHPRALSLVSLPGIWHLIGIRSLLRLIFLPTGV